MAGGLLGFALVLVFLVQRQRPMVNPQMAEVLTLAAAVLLVGGSLAGRMVRRWWVKRLRSRGSDGTPAGADELLPAFGTVTIVRAALAEAPGLFFLVIYMATGAVLGLVGAALALLALLAAFPTRFSFEAFAEAVSGDGGFQPR